MFESSGESHRRLDQDAGQSGQVAVNSRAIQHFARLRFAARVAWEKHDRCERAYRDDATPATRLAAVLGPRTQADAGTGHPLIGRRACWAHACRDDEVLCGRVELTVRADTRLGLAPRERRRVALRFVEQLHPTLRTELAELVRRRGSAARRAAERMDPIELVFADPGGGLQRILGWLEPPHLRHGDLHEIEFGLREPAP